MKRLSLAHSCCTTPVAIRYWSMMFVVFYVAALLLSSVWPPSQPYGDTLLLTALGSACFFNFGRNRTLHCGLTGPLFVVAAIAALLMESGIWDLNQFVLWGVVLTGVALAFVIEWRLVGTRERTSKG